MLYNRNLLRRPVLVMLVPTSEQEKAIGYII